MGKSQTAASSLVLAVPAAILAYFTIMAGLQHTESMPTMLMAVVWMTAGLSGLMALFPLWSFLLVKSGPVAAAAAAGGGAVAAAESGLVDASEPDVHGEVEDGDLAETTDLGEIPDADSELASEESLDEVEGLGDLDDDIQIDDDAFDMDDVEEEEEQPKKKKKK